MEPHNQTRLNKHLALQLGVSRREADDLIAKGKVSINGAPAVLGARLLPTDTVAVNGKPLGGGTDIMYLLFNKPTGYVCSRKAQGDNPTIYSLLPAKYHALKPVGRLDKDSSGLLLLTNDGDFAYRMTHPKFHKTKVYEVQLDKPLQPLHQQMICDYGVMLPDGPSKFLIIKKEPTQRAASFTQDSNPRKVQPEDLTDEALGSDAASPEHERYLEGKKTQSGKRSGAYEIHMSEGRNRQIRRTFAALGYTVTALHRTQFGNYSLGDMKKGEYKLTNIA